MPSGSFWNPPRAVAQPPAAPVPPAYTPPAGGSSGAPTDNCLEVSQVTSVSTVAGIPVRIARTSSGRMRVLSVSLQPDADCHVQILEGNSLTQPLSAVRFVQQDLLWSWRGKNIFDDLYLVCTEGSVNIQVEARTIGG